MILSLLNLFLIFFKIGAFTFGGGLAMIPIIKQEVINNAFMSLEEFVNFIAISESTPGPLAVNMSTFVGYNTYGFLGAIFSTFGVILPSFIIILIISKYYNVFKDNKYIKNIMKNLKPVIIGLICATFTSLIISIILKDNLTLETFTNKDFYISLVLFIIALIINHNKKSPILLIVLLALIGILLGFLKFI